MKCLALRRMSMLLELLGAEYGLQFSYSPKPFQPGRDRQPPGTLERRRRRSVHPLHRRRHFPTDRREHLDEASSPHMKHFPQKRDGADIQDDMPHRYSGATRDTRLLRLHRRVTWTGRCGCHDSHRKTIHALETLLLQI